MIKREKTSPEIVKVCPRCLSLDLTKSSFVLGVLPDNYSCQNCSYLGPIFLEVSVEDYIKFIQENQANESTSTEE